MGPAHWAAGAVGNAIVCAEPFVCSHPGCSYRSADSGALRRHQRRHTGEKPVSQSGSGNSVGVALTGCHCPDACLRAVCAQAVCDYPGCGYSCTDFSNLARHKRTHTGARPFQCQHPGCDYKASQYGTLMSHVQRRHSRKRDYPCTAEGCSYAAVHPGDLRSHVREQASAHGAGVHRAEPVCVGG